MLLTRNEEDTRSMSPSEYARGVPPNRRDLLERLREPRPEDTTLPADADEYLRLNPDDAEVREARERLPELDGSE
jgi:hypothetical protein